MPKIEPTVGRVLWFYEGDATRHAAIIAGVNDDGTVNVAAFAPDGHHFAASNVPLVQPGEASPPPRHCAWMPYQVGQAAKTEQTEKQSPKK